MPKNMSKLAVFPTPDGLVSLTVCSTFTFITLSFQVTYSTLLKRHISATSLTYLLTSSFFLQSADSINQWFFAVFCPVRALVW